MKIYTHSTLICVALMTFAVSQTQAHMFGPTGIHGNLRGKTISVTSIEKGSPADGKIAPKSVIIGVGADTFKSDVRREMAEAINIAETEAAAGKLTLNLKGDKQVELTLMVLGSYSDTAPYNCPKTDKIIARAAERIANNASSKLDLRMLGLLATGEQKYIDIVKERIHADRAITKEVFTNEKTFAGKCTWGLGYKLILYSEYYLMTGDDTVLPAIEAYSVGLASGQDAGGLWGHTITHEMFGGRLPGYAQMNQSSLSVFMGLILARKCGIDDPRLIEGIAKTHAFYSSFIGRGAFNYGVHGPNTIIFNNNGTSGSAALDMAFMGNTDGAAFFSKLAATSYDGLERGHTGPFFNVMWTPLGANVSGPEVSARFFKKSLWLNTLYRGWDGRFAMDGTSYRGCSSTGSHLLWYCLGRRKLLITGRDADTSLWVKGREAADVINASQIDYKSKSADELIQLANHPLPQVRRRAALAAREKRDEILPELDELLSNGTDHDKIFACKLHGPPQDKELGLPYMDAYGTLLRDQQENAWVRVAAASALAYMSDNDKNEYPAARYYIDIVRMICEDRPWDRFHDVDWALGNSANALCRTPLDADLITDKDKDVFLEAARRLVRNKRMHARGQGLIMLQGIPLEDFDKVADDLLHIIADDDRTYHSYHNPGGPVTRAISILANLNIKEGIDYAMNIMNYKSGKYGFKMRARLKCLGLYGANAKEQYLQLKKEIENSARGMAGLGKFRGAWKAMEKAITSDKNPPKLITLDEARKAGR